MSRAWSSADEPGIREARLACLQTASRRLLSGTTLAPWAAPFVGSHGTERERELRRKRRSECERLRRSSRRYRFNLTDRHAKMTIDHAMTCETGSQTGQTKSFRFQAEPDCDSRTRNLFLKSHFAHSHSPRCTEESRLEAGDASAYHARSNWRAQSPNCRPLPLPKASRLRPYPPLTCITPPPRLYVRLMREHRVQLARR